MRQSCQRVRCHRSGRLCTRPRSPARPTTTPSSALRRLRRRRRRRCSLRSRRLHLRRRRLRPPRLCCRCRRCRCSIHVHKCMHTHEFVAYSAKNCEDESKTCSNPKGDTYQYIGFETVRD